MAENNSKGRFVLPFLANKDKTNDIQQRLKESQESILHKKTPFVIQEAYRTARTNIIFSLSGEKGKCKKICITSANAGEGKTTTSLNMAITFAQTGSRVLLIDCDLRKPRIHQYLGVVKNDGLTTILSGQKEFEDVVFHNLRPGLDCITSGSIPPNPAELLASDNMSKLLSDLSEIYDYILLDTPPVTVVTDAVSLSQVVSGVMVVVREGYTNHESIEQALKLLKIANAKILGFFINDVDVSGINYGSYRGSYSKIYGRRYGKHYNYGYGYGYGYGYEYSDKKAPQIENKSKKSGLKSFFAKKSDSVNIKDTKQDTADTKDESVSGSDVNNKKTEE